MDYEIVKARPDEKDKIVAFFNKEWKKSQMLNEDKMFDFYFRNGNELQFVLAKRRGHSSIAGASGFFLSSESDVWLSNTCIKSGESPFLIFQILEYFKTIAPNIHDVNCTEQMKRIFQRAGFQTGEYIHFFRVIKEDDYKIIQITNRLKMPSISGFTNNVREITSFEEMQRITVAYEAANPKKTKEYIWHRYKEFPYEEFEYRIWLAVYEGMQALVVTREQAIGNAAILRIVDIIGQEICLKAIIGFLVDLGRKRNCEYVDCFCCGIPTETMRECGFTYNIENSCIIPDNFSPLQRENVTINYATNNIYGFKAFKADGDMDRPNLWR